MSEINPYAPPKVEETQASSILYWQCYGERVMARNGAMLPKVDLETGASDVEMTSVARSYQAVGAGQFIRIAVFAGIYVFAQNAFGSDVEWIIWTFLAAFILFGWLGRLKGGRSGTITIWEFREASREQRRRVRRRIRTGLFILACLLMIVAPTVMLDSNLFDTVWLLRWILGGLILLIANVIWSMFDRPSTRSESGPEGWLRLYRVHPEAMMKLRKIEADERAIATAASAQRKRLIRTCYLYKYPISILLGTGPINPFLMIIIVLMKLLRSKNLVRDMFHFSEAAEIPEGDLNSVLREKIHAWRLLHPDWSLLQAQRLPSPAGDLTVESATLVSPGLEHTIHFSHTWMEQKRSTSTCLFEFSTFVNPSRIIRTTHMPLLDLHRPRVDSARVKGGEEEVFLAHLARCAHHAIDAPADRDELLARIDREKVEVDELLEAAGYHGPVREAD